jgi:hypothetical protein
MREVCRAACDIYHSSDCRRNRIGRATALVNLIKRFCVV